MCLFGHLNGRRDAVISLASFRLPLPPSQGPQCPRGSFLLDPNSRQSVQPLVILPGIHRAVRRASRKCLQYRESIFFYCGCDLFRKSHTLITDSRERVCAAQKLEPKIAAENVKCVPEESEVG